MHNVCEGDAKQMKCVFIAKLWIPYFCHAIFFHLLLPLLYFGCANDDALGLLLLFIHSLMCIRVRASPLHHIAACARHMNAESKHLQCDSSYLFSLHCFVFDFFAERASEWNNRKKQNANPDLQLIFYDHIALKKCCFFPNVRTHSMPPWVRMPTHKIIEKWVQKSKDTCFVLTHLAFLAFDFAFVWKTLKLRSIAVPGSYTHWNKWNKKKDEIKSKRFLFGGLASSGEWMCVYCCCCCWMRNHVDQRRRRRETKNKMGKTLKWECCGH